MSIIRAFPSAVVPADGADLRRTGDDAVVGGHRRTFATVERGFAGLLSRPAGGGESSFLSKSGWDSGLGLFPPLFPVSWSFRRRVLATDGLIAIGPDVPIDPRRPGCQRERRRMSDVGHSPRVDSDMECAPNHENENGLVAILDTPKHRGQNGLGAISAPLIPRGAEPGLVRCTFSSRVICRELKKKAGG